MGTQDRKLRGKTGKSNQKALGVSVKDHISRARVSMTVMTSSFGDCRPGPLGLNLPAGSMDEAEVRKFNSDHAGEAFAILSDSRSHFMTSACFTKMLYSLYGPAFDAQRKRYGLDGKSRGKFLADAWTGFRSNEGGEALERNVWSQLNGVELPWLILC